MPRHGTLWHFGLFAFAFGSVLTLGRGSSGAEPPPSDPTAPARNRMVQRHLVEHGIKDPRVLDAFRTGKAQR